MTHAQLENPADLIANAARTILLADTPAWPFAPYAHRHFASMNINRVEILASNFERASDHIAYGNVANTATAFYDHRKGRLAFTVVSARTDQQTTDNHAYCVGRLGYLMSRAAQKWTPATIQNFLVLDLVDDGESPSESEKTDTDRTTRHFTIEFQIPPTVYAAAT